MLDLNPYQYDTVEYYEYELKVAKRNLELVTEAAVKRIQSATEESACEVATEMTEAIMHATNRVEIARSGLKRIMDGKNE